VGVAFFGYVPGCLNPELKCQFSCVVQTVQSEQTELKCDTSIQFNSFRKVHTASSVQFISFTVYAP